MINKRLLLILLTLASASAFGQYAPRKDEKFEILKRPDPMANSLISVHLHFESASSGAPADHGVWHQNQWGKEYLISAFGLQDYLTDRQDVVVVMGNAGTGYAHATHYVYHKTRKNVCVLTMLQRYGNGSRSSVFAHLVGCFDMSLPKQPSS